MTERIGMRSVQALIRHLVRWITLGTVLLTCLGAGAYAVPPPQAGYCLPDYTAGVKAYRLGNYETAVRYLKRVLIQDAANTNAHYYLALSLDNLGLATDAAAEYAQVISGNAEDADIVAYAKNRLQVLQPVTLASAAGNVALMAAGSQISPAVYHGFAGQVAVPLKNSKNALMVDATLTQGKAHMDGSFIIDTGATYTSISREMAQQLGLTLDRSNTVFITTANGRIEVPRVTIQTLSVNGLEAHNIEATVIPVRKGASFSGLLGLSFIRQFVVTIDPASNQLIFKKN
jgi:clan AA aspartic protease (TIGR02281 family)